MFRRLREWFRTARTEPAPGPEPEPVILKFPAARVGPELRPFDPCADEPDYGPSDVRGAMQQALRIYSPTPVSREELDAAIRSLRGGSWAVLPLTADVEVFAFDGGMMLGDGAGI